MIRSPLGFAAIVLLAGALVSWTGPARSSGTAWTPIGPSAGDIDALVASPFTPGHLWALASSGVFASTDGGISWEERSAGIAARLLDPPRGRPLLHSRTSPETLYLLDWRRVYFTSDGGRRWEDRSPPASLVGADTVIVWGTLSRTVPGRIYLGLFDNTVLRSDDAGRSWQVLTAAPALTFPYAITVVEAHPSRRGELIVAYRGFASSTPNRLYRVTGAGATWTLIDCPSGCPWEDEYVRDLQFAGGGRVWLTNGTNLGRSDDDGATWTTLGSSSAGRFVAPDPSDTDRVWVGDRSGIAYTEDGGASWTEVVAGFAGNGSGEPAGSTQIAFDLARLDRPLVGTTGNGVVQRTAAGVDVFEPVSEGLFAAPIGDIVQTAGALIVGLAHEGADAAQALYRSSDDGATWSVAGAGIAPDAIHALAVDPDNPDRVHAGGSNRPSPDGSGGFGPGDGGLYRSDDAGLNWIVTDTGITDDSVVSGSGNPLLTVKSLAVDPQTGSDRLWTGGRAEYRFDFVTDQFFIPGERVYRSNDNGSSWTPGDGGLGGVEEVADPDGIDDSLSVSIVDLVVDRSDPTGATVFAAGTITGATSPEDDPTPSVTPNGVFRSSDGGLNWIEANAGLPRFNGTPGASPADVSALVQDPTDASGLTLYAAVYDDDIESSVFVTVDGAATWSRFDAGLEGKEVRTLLIDASSGDLYAGVDGPGAGGVFVRPSGSTAWSALGTGLPLLVDITDLWLDGDAGRLLTGTDRGVWALDVVTDSDIDGVSDALEAAGPNGGDGNGDGIPDAEQAGVVSVPVGPPGTRGGDGYMTISVNALSGACDRIEQVGTLDQSFDVGSDPGHESPFNGLAWRLPDCNQAEVEWIHHGTDFADPSAGVRAWQSPDGPVTTRSWADVEAINSGERWTFTVADDGPGDADEESGSIRFYGAVKVLAEAFFADGMEAE